MANRAGIFAVGGDRPANLLWRLRHGEGPRGLRPRAILLLIGVNDILPMLALYPASPPGSRAGLGGRRAHRSMDAQPVWRRFAASPAAHGVLPASPRPRTAPVQHVPTLRRPSGATSQHPRGSMWQAATPVPALQGRDLLAAQFASTGIQLCVRELQKQAPNGAPGAAPGAAQAAV